VSSDEKRLLAVVLFDVDSDVLSVWLVGVGLVYSSLHQEDFDGGNSATDAGDAEHCCKEHCKQIPQDIDEKSESDEHQTDDEYPGCEVSGGLRYRVAVEAETHLQTSIVKEKAGPELEPAFSSFI